MKKFLCITLCAWLTLTAEVPARVVSHTDAPVTGVDRRRNKPVRVLNVDGRKFEVFAHDLVIELERGILIRRQNDEIVYTADSLRSLYDVRILPTGETVVSRKGDAAAMEAAVRKADRGALPKEVETYYREQAEAYEETASDYEESVADYKEAMGDYDEAIQEYGELAAEYDKSADAYERMGDKDMARSYRASAESIRKSQESYRQAKVRYAEAMEQIRVQAGEFRDKAKSIREELAASERSRKAGSMSNVVTVVSDWTDATDGTAGQLAEMLSSSMDDAQWTIDDASRLLEQLSREKADTTSTAESALPLSADTARRAEQTGAYYDFSWYKGVRGVQYVYLPGSIINNNSLKLATAGLLNGKFGGLDGMLFIVCGSHFGSVNLADDILAIRADARYQSVFEMHNGERGVYAYARRADQTSANYSELIFSGDVGEGDSGRQFLVQFIGEITPEEVSSFVQNFLNQ